MDINLESNISVSVDSFSFGYTYGGLLEGTPNERMNRNIYERTSYPVDWGQRKHLKIEPNQKEFENLLKPAYYSVWLNSHVPIDKEYHGSELVVTWFDDFPDGKTIEEIIESGIKEIDWKSHAQDFLY